MPSTIRANHFQHIGLGVMSADTGDSIDSRHPDYVANIEKYDLINTLLGGSAAMRGAGEKYLPKFKKEADEDYKRRLSRAFLNPSFSVAIESHASKPFSFPVNVEGNSENPMLSSLIDNADGQGNGITEFAKRLFTDGGSYGMTHVLADFSNNNAVSKADELLNGVGANLVHIRCLDLFYWDAELVGGKHKLTEIRYHREATVKQGEFGKRQAKQIVRWLRDRWEIWERQDSDDTKASNRTDKDGQKLNSNVGEWSIIESGVNSLGEIPLTTIYFKRTGFMQAEPPNWELAEVVLEHYQDMSDQKNLESVARVGMMFASGFDEEETSGISIGPKQLIQSSNTEAKFEIVEHSGSAVTIGRNSLKILEDKMEELALKPEINRTSGDVTASEVLSNAFNSASELIYWTIAVENGLREAFALAYSWINEDLADDFILEVYKDFTIVGNVSDMTVLLDSYREGAIDKKTYLVELKRRGSLDISHDIKSIMTASEKEADREMERAIKTAQASKPMESNNEDDDKTSNDYDSDDDGGMQDS